jgi:DegV family protein with EDD domain
MIKIISDTTSTITPDLAKKLGIPYLPQIIIFGDKSFRDDGELSTTDFLVKLKSSTSLPKTAAPPPALYTPIFAEIALRKDTAIVLCPSEKVSGTFRSATVAAQDFAKADIRIIDTQIIGPALGSLVLKADKMAKDGSTAEEILNFISNRAQKNKIYFYVDTLEYLKKGGRIGAAKALIGGILQVKPILLFKDGQVNPFESQRTKKKAILRIIELVKQECPQNADAELAILEADAMPDALSLKNELSSIQGINDIQISNLPPAIIVHAGPGVLAVSFFTI